MAKLPKSEKAIASLLAELQPRARTVIERRFGVGAAVKRTTLEAVGKTMGITRERVRQIEAAALKRMREGAAFAAATETLAVLDSEIRARGGVVSEPAFFNEFSLPERNAVHLLLTLYDQTKRIKEDEEFTHRWTADEKHARNVEEALRALHRDLEREEEPLPLGDLKVRLARQVQKFCAASTENPASDSGKLQAYLALSRRIGQNPLGEWGLVTSAQIRPRGIRDLSYVVMKKHGSPMHFVEVAKAITQRLNRPAHVQTVHNELIKDERFVLVGRGLYALKEWGYQQGTVQEVIRTILHTAGHPMQKAELLKRILKERHVKESTILINLQNRKYFQRLSDGSYSLV